MNIEMDVDSINDLLERGLVLPLMEEFYTLQGEGYHSGKAAYFIRVGGCDIGCSWCDSKLSWNKELYPATDIREILARVLLTPVKSVVVTGGEPSQYNLRPFTELLKSHGFETYLETSGTYPLTGHWDWVCLSPKPHAQSRGEYHQMAHELKVIIEFDSDFRWAEVNAGLVNKNCMLYLQPEWSKRESMLPKIVDYIRNNPKWRLSLQSHKYVGIP